LVEVLAGLGCYDWVVFTSGNGVEAFFEYFFRGFQDLRDLGAVRIAAVGPATAERLRRLHLKVDVVPKNYTAAEVAKALATEQSLENLRILLLRAEVATPDLPRLLEEHGAIVDDVACYRTAMETDDWNGAAARMLEQGADWITFTSGSTAENFHRRFNLPELLKRFPSLKCASVGPETTKTLTAVGLKPAIEANPHTLQALLAALEHYVKESRKGAGNDEASPG
jgi:uroporphyrinogen III methyltransferase/synthase